jgi:hypothetical protein
MDGLETDGVIVHSSPCIPGGCTAHRRVCRRVVAHNQAPPQTPWASAVGPRATPLHERQLEPKHGA